MKDHIVGSLLICPGKATELKDPVEDPLPALEAGEANEHAERAAHGCHNVIEVIQGCLADLLTQHGPDIQED